MSDSGLYALCVSDASGFRRRLFLEVSPGIDVALAMTQAAKAIKVLQPLRHSMEDLCLAVGSVAAEHGLTKVAH